MFKLIASLISEIADHTLRKDVNGFREWDRMKLTMFTAWLFALISATIYFIIDGFHFEVWLTFVGVALGSKLIDAQSKKISK
jgi:hypothetical protein